MSYILDALRKADAQRESDPARGIHAQPVRAANGEYPPEGGYRAAFWVAAGAGVAAVAAAGWYLSRGDGAPSQPVASAQVVAAAPAAQPAPIAQPASAAAAANAPAVPAVVATKAPAAAVLPPPPPVVAPPRVVAKPARVAAIPAPQEPAAAASAATPRPVAATRPAAAPVATAGGAAAGASASAVSGGVSAAARVPATGSAPLVAGLPPDAPKLAISGGVYSANVAQRMLIVNGQVFNEGSEIGPAVVLEEIRPKAAVVRFRGSRYSVSY